MKQTDDQKKESHRRSVTKYREKQTKQYGFNFNLVYDRDIIEFLDSQENKQGKLKEIIRAHMKEKEKRNLSGSPDFDF